MGKREGILLVVVVVVGRGILFRFPIWDEGPQRGAVTLIFGVRWRRKLSWRVNSFCTGPGVERFGFEVKKGAIVVVGVCSLEARLAQSL